MIQRALQGWALWVVVAVLVAGVGYTAGYLLSPPEQATVSRTLPDTQPDIPQPMSPRMERVNDA
jgi:hypothetical protein